MTSTPVPRSATGSAARRVAAAAIATLLAVPSALAQSGLARTLNPLSSDSNGPHLYSVSVYSGCYSSPQAFSNSTYTSGTLKPDIGFGASVALGWNYLRGGSGVSINYTPSYNAFLRYSDLSAFNHAFSIVIHNRRDPTKKWHTDVSAHASASTTNQYLFTPGSLGLLVDAPATFDEFAQAVVAGRFTNDQIASLLTGASLPQSPAEIALFGDYYLSAAVQARVSYASSSRFSVIMAVSGRRFESLPRSGTETASPHPLFNSTTGTAMIGIGYSLSPRTQFRFDLATTRTFSQLADSYNNIATFSLNRIMTRRWFAESHIGMTSIVPLRTSVPTSMRPQVMGGGGIGFKTQTSTFMAQSTLARSDPYGLGASSTVSAGLAWSWRPRSSPWSALVAADWQRMNIPGRHLSDAQSARASITRALSRYTGFTLAFGYLSNAGTLAGPMSNRVLRSYVLTVYWIPGGEKSRADSSTKE